IVGVRRGVFQTEVRHAHRTTFTLRSREGDRAIVYVRHGVPESYRLAEATPSSERVGDVLLFRAVVDPFKSTELPIEEETTAARSIDIRAPADLALLEAYLAGATLDAPLRARIDTLVGAQKALRDDAQRGVALQGQLTD